MQNNNHYEKNDPFCCLFLTKQSLSVNQCIHKGLLKCRMKKAIFLCFYETNFKDHPLCLCLILPGCRCKTSPAQTPKFCSQPLIIVATNICLADQQRPTQRGSARLSSTQSGPPCDVICLYLRGKKKTRAFKCSASRVFLPFCDSLLARLQENNFLRWPFSLMLPSQRLSGVPPHLTSFNISSCILGTWKRYFAIWCLLS